MTISQPPTAFIKPRMASRLALLACTMTIGMAADPAISIDRASLAVSADAGEIVATQITVTNTGTAMLNLRLRDSGSGVNGVAQAPQVLEQYQTGGWNAVVPGIAFDGLNIWRIEPNTGRFLLSDLETCTQLSTILPTGLTWKPGSRLVWDGNGMWVSSDANNYVAGQILPRRIAHYRPDGVSDAQILLGDETTTRAAVTNPAWDGRRVWYTDQGLSTAFTIDTASANARTQTPVLGPLQFFFGKDAWAGYQWGFCLRAAGESNGSAATDLIRVDPQTGVRTSRTILPVAVVEGPRGNNDGLYAHVVDGFGRFLAVTGNRYGLSVTHVDSGLRGWMTSPDTSHRRIDLMPGESRSFTIRLDGSTAGSGTHTSALWLDSNDAARRRVVVPVTFTVSTQPAASPVAVDDVVTTDRDVRLDVLAPGVMANDRGVAPLTAQVVTGPSHGSVTIATDGSLTYMPDARYLGVDHFTYRITDVQGRSSAPATVTVTVRDVPHIVVSPVSLGFGSSSPTQRPLQITNAGQGTLRVAVKDDGSGGAPTTITSQGRLTLRKDLFTIESTFCSDGQGFWSYNGILADLLRLDPATGAVLDRIPHGLPAATFAVGIAWTGQHLALVDRGILEAPPGNPGGAYIITVNPRIHLYDPRTRTLVRSIEIPVGIGSGVSIDTGLAFDGQYLWTEGHYLNTTYRTDLATGTTTVLPKLASSTPLGRLTWYDGSLWTKSGLSIRRYNPTTGVLLGTWNLPSSGDSTVYNRAITALGGGRFAVSAGSIDTPQILTVDTGMRGWLSVDPATVDVPAGQTVTVLASIDTTRVPTTTTTVILRVWSNDVDAREVQVPVTYTVDAGNRAPQISRAAEAGPAVLVLP